MVFTPRSELTPEQRQLANNKKRDKYNERKARELQQQLELKDKENAALRSAIKESNPGAGSRKTPVVDMVAINAETMRTKGKYILFAILEDPNHSILTNTDALLL